MRKSIFILVLAVVCGTANILAATPDGTEPKESKAIAVQIYNMFGENSIPNDIRGSKAEVRVAIDSGNFLRILSIETENENLEKFIRNSIDFKKLTRGTYQKGIVYRIPLEVKE